MELGRVTSDLLPAPQWELVQFIFSIDDGEATMTATCNGRRVITHLFEKNFSQSQSVKEKYFFFLKVAEEVEWEDYTVEDFYDWIAEPVFPIFRRLESLPSPPFTLDGFLFPESTSVTLRADEKGARYAVLYYDEDPYYRQPFGIDVEESICSSWPSFRPSAILPCRVSDGVGRVSPIPSKVLLPDGRSAFFKLMRKGDTALLRRELSTYGKIRDAGLDGSLQNSRLIGLVRDLGCVFGLLLTYIDCRRRTLSCAVRNQATDLVTRQKWARQIEDTVVALHRGGVVWGDAKPDNILIDREGDAWLVDFGGSYTKNWVPKEQKETVEGDLAALRKIKEFIVNK